MDTLISGVVSFFIFHFVTHPKYKIHRKLPSAKIKRFQFSPRISIEAKNRVLHLHHWMLFTPIYLFAQYTGKGIFQSDLLQGFLIGGIVQGLMYKDSFKLIHRNSDFYQRVADSSYHRFSFLKKILN